jgi:predicted metalloprotease with PDZ domain
MRCQFIFKPSSCVGLLVLVCSLSVPSAFGRSLFIQLDVDASDAPKQILHARLHIPAQPGKLTLYYPKWIPGEHGPNGPITDLVGLKMSAGDKPVEWRRDAEDMYALALELPAGTEALEVALDLLLSAGADATSQLLALEWNTVLLYPKGFKASELQYTPSLRLPEDWKYGTALIPTTESNGVVHFEPVSLETLVDSPVIAGAHFRTVDLTPGAQPAHFLHVVADSAAALELKPEDSRHYSRLVAEAGALFGARHYRSYHFLLTLSDHVSHFGLEHHESSDNRQSEKYFLDEDWRKMGFGLLPHEMVHSWNGKYRRPAGLATPDYQQPMKGELLWVYEGLTSYLGPVLSARSGLESAEQFRQSLALMAARLDRQPGRTWRPLVDTTVAAQLLYGARKEGAAWRRGTDFYSEGDLIWLEADVRIRQLTQGRRSLDDFCQRFYGGQSGSPAVVAYTLDDVLAALEEVAPAKDALPSWRQFFQERVYATTPHAPLGGIENAGWRLAYTNTPPEMLKSLESARKYTDLTFSIGLLLKEDGTIQDVLPGSPADKAGLGSGMKMLGVNNRRWTAKLLRTAVQASCTNSAPIELLVENQEFFKTCKLDYHEGDKYPCLQRDPTKADLLSEILKPRTPAP